MNKDATLPLTRHTLTILMCFFAGCLFILGINHTATWVQNISSIFFIFFLIALFFFNLKFTESKNNKLLLYIMAQFFFLTLGIALSAQLLRSPKEYFWVQDSIYTHLPESLKLSHILWDGALDFQQLISVSGRTTHLITSVMMMLFGQNIFATILAQFIFKLASVFCIYQIANTLWEKKIAILAILIYGLCPTVFFYTLVLYKESAVQFLVALSILASLKIFKEKKYIFLLPLILCLTLLLNERFYISIIFLPSLLGLFFSNKTKSKLKNIFYFTIITVILVTLLYFLFPSKFTELIEKIQQQRAYHSSFTDVVNQFNYKIPYPLAFMKILFSPYFSFNKFNIFVGLSSLLTWGSFVNQLIILSAVLGLIKLVRQNIFHLYLWLPFIIFLTFAAYISPWSGRIRDSFYPLIACYAAYYLYNNKYFQKIFRLKNETTK